MEQSDIRQWVESNARELMVETHFTNEELDHLAMCMHHIYRWYHEGYPLGDFLTAIVQDKFTEACFRADDINRKALYLYALFLANEIGYDYRDKAIGKIQVKPVDYDAMDRESKRLENGV